MATFGNWSFYDPTSSYGGSYAPGSFATSPAGTNYFNDNRQAWWTQQTAPYASDNSAFARFVQSRYQPWSQGYDAALGTNPYLNVPQYGAQTPLNEQYFRGLFSNLSPTQRGESSSMYGGGRIRWIS